MSKKEYCVVRLGLAPEGAFTVPRPGGVIPESRSVERRK
jgi:hypothetical protein